jgi:hypothetical protein
VSNAQSKGSVHRVENAPLELIGVEKVSEALDALFT